MKFKIIISESVKEKLKTLDKSIRKRIIKKIKQLKTFPEQRGKHLKAPLHPLIQTRVGNYRIWYEVDNVKEEVYIEYVKHKKEAKKFY